MNKMFKVLLLIETSEMYGQRLLRGIVKYSQFYGPWTFYTEIPLYRRTRNETKMSALQMGCNGVITYLPNSKIHVKDVIGNLPAVVFHGTVEIPTLDSSVGVISDFEKTGCMGAEYLLRRGFKNFAYCGFKRMYWSDARGESFVREIKKAGFATHCYFYIPFANKDKSNVCLADWLKSLPKPIGLMACNDDVGQQVINICQIENIFVPDEIAVLGVDDDDLICGLTNPPMSSVSLGAEKAGYEAAEVLDKLMLRKKIGEHIIFIKPTHIVSRQSTEILAVEDQVVAEALRFIRLNSEKMIQVLDVVNYIGVSRTTLSERFLKNMGHSIHDEIKHVRNNRIANYLIDTNMSISDIAIKMGYTDVGHISRYFKSYEGVSPQTYREKYKL
ncbi:MAG: hypothetical protein A2Y12_05705 [Planctomycetes bacterium GWF2_42_9]|nr:MAG: hypothetical protein A2Y12_05705 [Planctomycetes bacterium GWF2_42_9]